MRNFAFIDGQNLRYNTLNSKRPWVPNLAKFRVYLREKYLVDKAYYFVGAYVKHMRPVYQKIHAAGYILIFREHPSKSFSRKKGNVDTDIVFMMMRVKNQADGVILVSGDGDYFRTVKHLVRKDKFVKLLAVNKNSTSRLYRDFLDRTEYDYLETEPIRAKIS